MKVIRSYDGVAFDFSSHHLANVEGLTSLQDVLGPVINLETRNMILMTSTGSQLTDNILRSILEAHRSSTSSSDSGTPSSSKALPPRPSTLPNSSHLLYAFDRQHLSEEPTEILNSLAFEIEDALEPSLPTFDPTNFDGEAIASILTAHHKCASTHLRTTLLLLSHVRAQKSSLEVALNNLDKFREAPRGALEAFETFAQPLVQDYGNLLEAFGPAFALAKQVKIHPHLLSTNLVNRPNSNSTHHIGNSTGAIRVKYMGDYVMEDRINQIKDRCFKVYEDFRARFNHIRQCTIQVNEGAVQLRAELNSTECDLQDLDELERDAEEGACRAEEVVLHITQLADDERETLIELFNELKVLDEDSRERIACLIERKNFWLHRLLSSLHHISNLQGIIPTIGIEVQGLNADLKTRTDSFKHLARLKDFVTAYASTVVEVVRRREFARHLSDYSSALSASLTKLVNDERKRRIIYRSDYGGKIPFVVEGLDDNNVPAIEFQVRNLNSAQKSKDSERTNSLNGSELAPLTRADVDEMIASLRVIETSNNDTLAKAPAREVRLLVEKQLSRLEAMESAFAQALERFVMTESATRSPANDAEQLDRLSSQITELLANQEEMTDQLRTERLNSAEAARKSQVETQQYLRTIENLKLQLVTAKDETRQKKAELCQGQLLSVAERENLTTTIASMQSQIGSMDEDLKIRSKALADSERQLTSARVTADDATRELHELEARHQEHLSDHQHVLSQLQQARDRTDEVERELTEVRKTNEALSSELTDKVKLLDSQVLEAEQVRIKMEQEKKKLSISLESEKTNSESQSTKLQQLQAELEELKTRHKLDTETHLASQKHWEEHTDELKSSLDNRCLTLIKALQAHQEAHHAIQDKINTMPRLGSSQQPTSTTTSTNKIPDSVKPTGSPVDKLETPITALSSDEFEKMTQGFLKHDPNSLAKIVQQKLDLLANNVRKWMKESKGFHERAKRYQAQAQVKITFRDFAKGDLALFLPTRNPTAQVWAAFNVSFPHYFLQANDSVSPIIKSREWLVARIISLTEKLVDPKDPETNPFQLPNGTRYFLLEVEPWSSEKPSRKVSQSVFNPTGTPRARTFPQAQSATLPPQTPPQASTSSTNKRRSLVEVTPVSHSESSPPRQLPASVGSKPFGEDLTFTPLADTTPSSKSTVDLNQSEFTVIEPLAPPSAAQEIASDSPFRTTLESPSQAMSVKPAPSGLALSLKSFHKSPSPLVRSNLRQKMIGEDIEEGEETKNVTEFRPSESARPAFLASMSFTSSTSSPRTTPSSVYQAPVKPRMRPIPKAHSAIRSSSRASSLASSANLNPTIRALFQPGSPLVKGSTTVSTSFRLSEKNTPKMTTELEHALGQSGSLVSTPPTAQPTSSLDSPNDKTKRRISFPGTGHLSMMMSPNGLVGNGNNNGNSSRESSLSGSGLYINSQVINGSSLSRSPSLNTNSNGPKSAQNGNNQSNSLSASLFGTWRRRKESLNLQAGGSTFGGASDLLRRFSSSQN